MTKIMTRVECLLFSAVLAVLGFGVANAQDILQTNDSYFINAQKTLKQRLALKPIVGKAKNVILFVADGNSVTSNTLIRIYDGQKRGETGEENVLSYERFPYLALSKTYNDNYQTPDSSGTMTAMVTGAKTKAEVVSVRKEVLVEDCEGALKFPLTTLGELANARGLSVGIVSTARLTHATPASVYAHSASRYWENDSDLPEGAKCKDIAAQLIEFPFDLAMGGGRRNFLPKDVKGVEGKNGKRTDGRNLMNEWLRGGNDRVVVQTEDEFKQIDPSKSQKVLGLFNYSHMQYEADRLNDQGGEPSLADMTKKAIKLLSNNEKGYFLTIEAGRVDHAHHDGNAARALEDGVAFNQAIKAAAEMTDVNETLIIVTADHGHSLGVQGYAQRGNDVLGLVIEANADGTLTDEPALAADGKPYTVIGYLNGPGSVYGDGKSAPIERPDLTNIDTADIDYIQQALVPYPDGGETHSGTDVAIYARGPMAFLIGGTVEQNYIFHVMANALGINP